MEKWRYRRALPVLLPVLVPGEELRVCPGGTDCLVSNTCLSGQRPSEGHHAVLGDSVDSHLNGGVLNSSLLKNKIAPIMPTLIGKVERELLRSVN